MSMAQGTGGMLGMVAGLFLTLAAVACSGSSSADGQPDYSDASEMHAAGSASSAQTQTERQNEQAAPVQSAECAFRGTYRLTSVLASGAASCSDGLEIEDAQIQSSDADACTAKVRVDGLHFVDVTCERGSPVADCTATLTGGSGACEYVWTLSLVD